MENFINLKYEEWVNSGKYGLNSLEDYISLEIYPEDIEIFSTVLLPETFIFEDYILLRRPNINLDEQKSHFLHWSDKLKCKNEAQKTFNNTNVSDIFLNTSQNSSESTLLNVARLIKFNWENFLVNKYQHMQFNVVIGGENFDPSLTFYQI